MHNLIQNATNCWAVKEILSGSYNEFFIFFFFVLIQIVATTILYLFLFLWLSEEILPVCLQYILKVAVF